MITTVVADDEAFARERLREQLERFALFDIVAEAADGSEALNLIITRKPQVAFLDINMPGTPVFTSLRSLQDPPLIVFQTAYSEHAAAAFDIEALDYLVKPVRLERLEKTVAKIKEALAMRAASPTQPAEAPAKPAERLTVTVNGKTLVIAVEDVIRISFEDGFCYLYTVKEKLMSDKYLSYYEERLTGGRFFRVSRTDIINLSHITTIHKQAAGLYTVELRNGTRVDVSRRRVQLLRDLVDF